MDSGTESSRISITEPEFILYDTKQVKMLMPRGLQQKDSLFTRQPSQTQFCLPKSRGRVFMWWRIKSWGGWRCGSMRSVRKGDWKKVQHSAHIQLDYWLRGKESACNAGNTGGSGSIPQSGRSPGESNGYPFQYSGLENPMDRGAWQAIVHGVAKSRTQLSDWSHRHTDN